MKAKRLKSNGNRRGKWSSSETKKVNLTRHDLCFSLVVNADEVVAQVVAEVES